MSWVTFETTDGSRLDAWLVTDEADTPGGTDARMGQWVVREPKNVEGIGPTVSLYTVDQPPPEWKMIAADRAGSPANSPIPLPDDPCADLWGMDARELSELAAELKVEFNPNFAPGRPPKYNLVKQIDFARRGAIALLETKPAPIGHNPAGEPPHPGPASAVEIDPGPYEG